jgi:hypothetical protein
MDRLNGCQRCYCYGDREVAWVADGMHELEMKDKTHCSECVHPRFHKLAAAGPVAPVLRHRSRLSTAETLTGEVIELVVVGLSGVNELCFVARVSIAERTGRKRAAGAFREKFASWSDQETEKSLWVEGRRMRK